jgi:hypothetical protein
MVCVCGRKLQFQLWLIERLFIVGDRGSGILDVKFMSVKWSLAIVLLGV